MNPRRIRTQGTFSPKAIEKYVRNGGRGGDTPVCVVKLDGLFGGYFAREGAHRIEAAKQAGRSVPVLWVHEREEQGR